MNCDQFQRSFDELVETRQSLSEEMIAHGENCVSHDCQERLEEHRRLESAIGVWKQSRPVPVVDVVDSIVDEVTADRVEETIRIQPRGRKLPLSRSSRFSGSSIATAIATACLLVAILGIVGPQSIRDSRFATTETEIGNTVQESPQLAEPDIPIKDEVFDLEAMTEYGRSYSEWFQGTAHKLKGTMTVVLTEGDEKVVEPAANWFFSLGQQLETLDAEFDSTIERFVPSDRQEMDDQTSLPATTDSCVYG